MRSLILKLVILKLHIAKFNSFTDQMELESSFNVQIELAKFNINVAYFLKLHIAKFNIKVAYFKVTYCEV